MVFASARDVASWGTHLEKGRAVLHARAVDTEARLAAVKTALARPAGRGSEVAAAVKP